MRSEKIFGGVMAVTVARARCVVMTEWLRSFGPVERRRDLRMTGYLNFAGHI